MNCQICNQPLEHEISPENVSECAAHDSCCNCVHCEKPVSKPQAIKCALDGEDVAHKTCRDNKMDLDWNQKEITITQGHLASLNERRLMIDYDPEKTLQGNILDTEGAFHRMFFHLKDLDAQYAIVKKLETLTVLCAKALGANKQKAMIEVTLKDKKRMVEVTEYRKTEAKAKEIKARPSAEQKLIDKLCKLGFSQDEAIAQLSKSKQTKNNTPIN